MIPPANVTTWKDVAAIVNELEIPCMWKGGEAADGAWVKVAYFMRDSAKLEAVLVRLPLGVTIYRLTLDDKLGHSKADIARLLGAPE